MFGTDEAPLSKEEMEAVKQNARERLGLWRKRGLYSTAALFLSCLLVYLFLAGSPLHAYWDSFGKYLLFPTMGLLLVFVYCTGLWCSAWLGLRDLENGKI